MNPDSLCIYVHIPHCKQRCTYCDFAIFTENSKNFHEDYWLPLKKEIKKQARLFPGATVKTCYFGGGTPSLPDPQKLQEVLSTLKENFHISEEAEISLEANPEDLNENKLQAYIKQGFNRISVGVQTFEQNFLKKSSRIQNHDQTLKALSLLQKSKMTFSIDLMFGLPNTQIASLKEDLKQACSFEPHHMSLYNLTLKQNHPLNENRPSEQDQIQMFYEIEDFLSEQGLKKYEISNYARASCRSRHNLAYWQGESFLGFGLSAHSYLSPKLSEKFFGTSYGCRFWNSKNWQTYSEQSLLTSHSKPTDSLLPSQWEVLKKEQALTDFFHTRLRMRKGFSWEELQASFSKETSLLVKPKLLALMELGWIEEKNSNYFLSRKGEILSNQVFLELTFLEKMVQ